MQIQVGRTFSKIAKKSSKITQNSMTINCPKFPVNHSKFHENCQKFSLLDWSNFHGLLSDFPGFVGNFHGILSDVRGFFGKSATNLDLHRLEPSLAPFCLKPGIFCHGIQKQRRSFCPRFGIVSANLRVGCPFSAVKCFWGLISRQRETSIRKWCKN